MSAAGKIDHAHSDSPLELLKVAVITEKVQ